MKKIINCDVVIPTFRNNNTINRAIDSVLNQSVSPNKIIIVDDYSNDEEYLNILKKLESKEFIEIIYLDKNSGPGTARNKGIMRSRSKYIAFLDSDDAWHPKKLEIQYHLMENESYYLSSHNTIYKNNNIEEDPGETEVKALRPTILLFKNIIATRSVMMRNDRRYFFKENKRFSEDYLLWLEIAFDKNKIGYINNNLGYHFYNNFSSGLSSNQKEMFLGEIENYSILAKNKKISNLTRYLVSLVSFIKYINRIKKIYKLNKGYK